MLVAPALGLTWTANSLAANVPSPSPPCVKTVDAAFIADAVPDSDKPFDKVPFVTTIEPTVPAVKIAEYTTKVPVFNITAVWVVPAVVPPPISDTFTRPTDWLLVKVLFVETGKPVVDKEVAIFSRPSPAAAS